MVSRMFIQSLCQYLRMVPSVVLREKIEINVFMLWLLLSLIVGGSDSIVLIIMGHY